MNEKPPKRRRVRLFIGSSKEGLEYAKAIELGLQDVAEVTLWDKGLFETGKGNLEELVEKAGSFEFAVLLFTADDEVKSRGGEWPAPRDNVIFELGLFMGKLGRFRTFLVYNEDEDIKIPSDLAGVTHATFRRRETDRNIRAQVSPACTKIEDAIRQQGGKEGAAEIIRDPEPNPAIARATVSTMKKIELSEQAQWVFNTLVYYQRKFVGDSDQTGAWWMYFIHPSAPQFKFFLTGVAELLNKDLAAVPADSEKVQVHLTWEGVRYSRTPGAYDENNRYMFEGIQDKPFEEPTASGS